MFKDLEKKLPLVTVYILLFGLIKQLIYYLNFNLPIKYFIGLSELGLLMSDNLILSVVVMLLGTLVLHLFATLENYIAVMYAKKNRVSDLTKHILTRKEQIQVAGICIVAFAIAFVFILPNESYSEQLMFYGVLTIVIFLPILIFSEYINIKLAESTKQVLLLSAFLFAITLFLTSFEITSVMDNGKYDRTIIITNDNRQYISNDTSFFIGKTEKYIFYYRTKIKGTQIIPVESVKEFLLVSK